MRIFTIKTLITSSVAVVVVGVISVLLFNSYNKLDSQNVSLAPNDWFFMQRAFPHDDINYSAYKMAFQQSQQAKMNFLNSLQSSAQWEFGGPVNLGGRISAVARHPSELSLIYVGAASGGVFKSVNAGLSWIPVFEDALSLSIGDIEIAASNPNIIYVGTGESNAGGGSMAYDGFGVYRSLDGGNEWEHLGLEESGSIGRVVIHPQDPDIVYIAAMGRLFSNNAQRGIFKTSDGGSSWEKVLYISDSTGGIDLVMDPSDPEILYAAMWERIRTPDRRQYGGPGCGIYKTTDGGSNWIELQNGLPSNNVGRIGIDISISDPNILYTIYADSVGFFAGIFKTTDKGENWTQTNDASLSGMYASFGWWFGRIHVDPTNSDIVYPIGFDLYKSDDGGQSYANISAWVHVDQHDLSVHPSDPDNLVLGNDGGIYISGDAGNTWTHLENLPVMQFYTCEVDEQFPERLYGGAQDMGTNRTLTGGTNDWHSIYGGDGFYVLVDPLNNSYIYAEYQYGGLARSINGGVSFSAAVSGIDPYDRKNWKSPLIFDPLDPSILYFGANRLYRSVNRAALWEPISPDLSNGGGAFNQVYGTLTTIAMSPSNRDYIYCGTDDGNVWVTKNGGIGWTMISDDLPLRWITNIAVDPYNPERAFVCLSGFRNDSYLPHVFMTDDAGINWIDISSGIPEGPVNDIIVDPSLDSCLYVASDFGVFVTWDYGISWNVLGDGLPNVPIVDLRLHNPSRKLVAASYGRSMYTFNLDAIVGIAQSPVPVIEILLFPNPAKNDLSILTEDGVLIQEVRIFNLMGKEVVYEGNSGNTIDISMLVPGLYIVEVNTRAGSSRQKLLVER